MPGRNATNVLTTKTANGAARPRLDILRRVPLKSMITELDLSHRTSKIGKKLQGYHQKNEFFGRLFRTMCVCVCVCVRVFKLYTSGSPSPLTMEKINKEPGGASNANSHQLGCQPYGPAERAATLEVGRILWKQACRAPRARWCGPKG